MKWKLPHRTKVYEALGTIADGRLEVQDDSAKCYSSSREKHYDVKYDEKSNAIMSNDNAAYWQGTLGYPSIAFLMLKGKLKYDDQYSGVLKGIRWKDINTKFKNDFAKTEEYILDLIGKKGIDRNILMRYVDDVMEQIKNLNLEKYGPRTRPPQGY
jgi:hypothetical protein